MARIGRFTTLALGTVFVLGLSNYSEAVYRSISRMHASWYGTWKHYHGHKTASGVIFDKDNPHMAAHPTLPFGTKLSVCNPAKKAKPCEWIVVVDRGPFVAGRSLDVSQEAARRLGFRFKGHQTLHVSYLGRMRDYKQYFAQQRFWAVARGQ